MKPLLLIHYGLVFFLLPYFTQAQTFLWAKSVGGPSEDTGRLIATDGNGNIYIAGTFKYSVDFDPGINEAIVPHYGNQYYQDNDIFIAKYTKNGEYLWAIHIGGEEPDNVEDMAVDTEGNVYITGNFADSLDFDPSDQQVFLKSVGQKNIYLAKYDGKGNYQWAHSIGDISTEYAYGISVDIEGNVYLTGELPGGYTDFDPSPSTALLYHNTSSAFIAKYRTDGTYEWAKNLRASISEGKDVTIDLEGNIIITGRFSRPTDFDFGDSSKILETYGNDDIYIAKYDKDKNYQWAINIGGTGYSEQVRKITTDDRGNVFVTGSFTGTIYFDQKKDSLTSQGNNDIFIAKYDSAGVYQWAIHLGKNSLHPYPIEVRGIAADGGGNVYITGAYRYEIDFDPGPDTANITNNKYRNAFIAKYNTQGKYVWVHSFGGTDDDIGFAIYSDRNNIYFTGYYEGIAVDFEPDTNETGLTSKGWHDIYFAKIHVYCTPPIKPATSIVFGEATRDEIPITRVIPPFRGADGYVIKINSVNQFTTPVDGKSLPIAHTQYQGGEQVIYASKDQPTALQVTELKPRTTYYFKAFAFNTCLDNYAFETEGLVTHARTEKLSQHITFEPIVARSYAEHKFKIPAQTNAPLSITFESSNPEVAVIQGDTVIITGVGSTQITAKQSGNQDYYPANEITQNLTVIKASQTIILDSIAPKNYGDSTFYLTGITTSALDVQYKSSNPSVATISDNLVTMVGAGATVITAYQDGNENYLAAADISKILLINKATQSINFSLGQDSLKNLNQPPFPIQATSSTGLPVRFYSTDPKVATVTKNLVTIKGRGITQIVATQGGNNDYQPAPEVSQTLRINLDKPTGLKVQIVGRHSVQLTWDIEKDQIRQTRIERRVATSQRFKEVFTGNISTYIDSSLAILPGQTYYYRVIAKGDGGIESLPSETVGVKIPTDEIVTQLPLNAVPDRLLVFPNPSQSGTFKLKHNPLYSVKGSTLTLVNEQGKVIRQYTRLPKLINLQAQPDGIYFLLTQHKNQMYTHKLIKK